MENAEKKKKLLYSIALLFICLVLTLSTSLTFAYFFNRRGETASYRVGQVKLDMYLGELDEDEYREAYGDTNYSYIELDPVKQLIPNMPMFTKSKIELARKRDNGGNLIEGEYDARSCYVRLRFFFEFVGEDGRNLLTGSSSPLTDADQASLRLYLGNLSSQLASSGVYHNGVYNWVSGNDSCFYLVKHRDGLESADLKTVEMYELKSTGSLVVDGSRPYGDSMVFDDEKGSREGAYAYLTTGEFRYPSTAENFRLAHK